MNPKVTPAGSGARPNALDERRRAIHIGLRRSFYAVVGVSILVGLLAVAAVWLSREAQQQAQDAETARRRAEASELDSWRASRRLWHFGSTAATLQRKTGREGQRTQTLNIIAEAARHQPSRQLRDEALSALLLPDLGSNVVWRERSDFVVPSAFDPDLEFYIQNSDTNRAIVRRVSDDVVMMDLPGFGTNTCFSQFSPDERLAAIAFPWGRIGLWDWRARCLVTQIEQAVTVWGRRSFDFAPDSSRLWFLGVNGTVNTLNLASMQVTCLIRPSATNDLFRLSPSGKLAALAGNKRIEIWDLAARTRRASLMVPKDIWCLAWHPDEERLAIGCEGELSLWEIGMTNQVLAEDSAVTAVCFNQDGDLLYEQGWQNISRVWNLRTGRIAFQPVSQMLTQLSRDGTHAGTYVEKLGYGVREMIARCGVHIWLAPPSMGKAAWCGDLDPKGRWLLTAHPRGWLIRDAETGVELVRSEKRRVFSAAFGVEGSKVLAWTERGLESWPLLASGTNGSRNLGEATTLWAESDALPSAACFAAGGRYAARADYGMATIVDSEDPSHPVRFKLQRPHDNCLYLSPDGSRLLTGFNHQKGFHVYDDSGSFKGVLNQQGLGGPVFNPVTGQLYLCDALGYGLWDLSGGILQDRVRWSTANFAESFIGFSPKGRIALVKTATGFSLFDLKRSQDFATLELPEPTGLFGTRWSGDGARLFLFAADGAITRLDLNRLRTELRALGLDWPDQEPAQNLQAIAKMMPPGVPVSATGVTGIGAAFMGQVPPEQLVAAVAAALLITILVGLYVLRYQRRLFGRYLEIEAVAATSAAGLKNAETALVHSQKMKALGTLSAGVAHDFNNLLSIIRLSNELIEEQVQPQGITKENFDSIQKAVQRGQGIVNSMLGYARDESAPTEFGVEELLSEAVALLTKPFLGGLILRVLIEPHLPHVFARKGRVEQMLFNLVVNAAEALKGRGTLTLGARLVAGTGDGVLPPRPAGSYVQMFVEDDGPGIPPQILPRIFEPFFTTKTKGGTGGTGLGLSMVYSMAKEDGVGVAVETEAGRGTVFRVFLPLDKSPAQNAPVPLRGATRPLPAGRGPGDSES